MLELLRVFLFDNVKQFILEEKLVSFFDHCEVEWLHVTGWQKAYNLTCYMIPDMNLHCKKDKRDGKGFQLITEKK